MSIKKLVGIILFSISVIMIGFGFYILNSNKYIFEIVLTKSLDYFVQNYNNDNLVNTDKYMIVTNTNVTTAGTELMSLSGDMYINNDKAYFDFDSSLMGKKFIGIESLLDNEKIYLKIKEVMENFYYIDFADTTGDVEASSININALLNLEDRDLKVLTNHFKKSILQDLQNDDFEKNSEALILNNKRFQTNRISLKLSEKQVNKIVVNLLENIGEDNKAIQVLQKINKNITKDDITTIVEDLKRNNSSVADDDIIDIRFYLVGSSNVLRFEIATLNNNVDSIIDNNLTFVMDNYLNSSNNSVTNIVLKENNQEIINVYETKIDDNNYNSSILINYEGDTILLEGKYTVSSTNLNMSFSILVNNDKVGNFVCKINTLTKNKEYKVEFSFTSNDESSIISSVNNIYLNEIIPNIDIVDAKDFNTMDENETEEVAIYIYEKLSEVGLDEYLFSLDSREENL